MIDPDKGAVLWNKLAFTDSGVLRVSPGVVTISGNDLKIGWDVQNATATAGAVTKKVNAPLKEFDADFYLSNEQDANGVSDFDEWDAFQAFLESTVPDNKKPHAVDVYHPDLARNHITAVTLGSIGGLVSDKKGGGSIKVHFLEYRPPKPLKAVPSTKTEGDKQIDADLAEIQALQNEYQHL